MYTTFYFVDYFSDLPHIHKVDYLLSKLLKYFTDNVFYHTGVYNFPKLVFVLINIHFLGLILWNGNMDCMR